MPIINDMIGIIRELNGGIVIPDVEEKERVIGTEIHLFRKGDKHYYMCEYTLNESSDNMVMVEKEILNYNKDLISEVPPKPQDSYLILFYLVDVIDESVHKKTIALEENEYFFKRYVFYFTRDEFHAFSMWFSTRMDKTLNAILLDVDVKNAKRILPIDFLLRLLVKLPFMQLHFTAAEMTEFDTILESVISSTRGNTPQMLRNMNSTIKSLLEIQTDENQAASMFFNERLGAIL